MKGFTLVEVLVVLAVLLLLSSVAIPLVSGYVDDARDGRAAAEVKLLAAAVGRFQGDVGRMPGRAADGRETVRVLVSGPELQRQSPFAAEHLFGQWMARPDFADSIDNHLLTNTPGGSPEHAYPESGPARWRGPYLAGSAPLDPWGRPYLINVVSAFSDSETAYFRVFVLSAGANGYLETSPYARRDENVAGDDIGTVIYERR